MSDDPTEHVTITRGELQAIRDTLALVPELVRKVMALEAFVRPPASLALAVDVERNLADLARWHNDHAVVPLADPGGAPISEIVETSPNDLRREPSERPRSITPVRSTPAAVLREIEHVQARARRASETAIEAQREAGLAREAADALTEAIAERELGTNDEE